MLASTESVQALLRARLCFIVASILTLRPYGGRGMVYDPCYGGMIRSHAAFLPRVWLTPSLRRCSRLYRVLLGSVGGMYPIGKMFLLP